MKIELHESDDDLLWPKCNKALRSISTSATYHDDWGTRPPLGIYNVSLSMLPRRFAAVLDCLDELGGSSMKPGPEFEKSAAKLLDAHQALLYALAEHLVDCQAVARVFFPKVEATKKEPSLRDFLSRMKRISDPVDRIVNAVKHRQARLGLVQAENQMVVIRGYCVQNVIQPGVIGPDRSVHRAGARGIAAISLPYDLRRLFCTIYAAGDLLDSFMRRLQASSNFGHGENAAGATPCDWSFEMASRIAKILPFVYPHEIRPPIPIVEAGSNAMSAQTLPGRWIRVELATSPASKLLTFGQIPGGQFRISVSYSGDGVTRSYKII